MTANELLLWMSARGQGSWSQFRAAVEELHIEETENTQSAADRENSTGRGSFPLYQSLRLNLQRLAHSEFFAGAEGEDWRVTPPSLSVVRYGDQWIGVVTGARSDILLRRLKSATGSFEIETVTFEACPDQMRLVSRDVLALSVFAENTGLFLQRDAPFSILASLPPVDHPVVRRPHDLPFGADWKIEQFSATNLNWKIATRETALAAAAGLFRFSLAYRSHVLLCLHGNTYEIPTQVGKYYVLRERRKKILSYDALTMRLSIPASCRPPFLVERALILCSGMLPTYERRQSAMGLLHYSDIPEAVARLASALLRQGPL
jgi:hypothetical protein